MSSQAGCACDFGEGGVGLRPGDVVINGVWCWGSLGLFGWLALVYASSQAYASRVAAPLEIVDVVGTGGGTPDGEIGSTQTIDIPGAAPGDQASNNESDASEFEEPSLMATPSVMIDAASEAGTTGGGPGAGDTVWRAGGGGAAGLADWHGWARVWVRARGWKPAPRGALEYLVPAGPDGGRVCAAA